MSNQEILDYRWILKVLRKWLWLIALLAVLAGLVAFIVTRFMPPIYQSSVTLMVKPASDTSGSEYSSLIASQQMAITYGQMLKTHPVLDETIKKLGLKLTHDQLAKKVTVETVRDTQLIRMTVSAENPSDATIIANTMAEIFINQIQVVQNQRYASAISALQTNLDTLNTKIVDTQAKIDQLNLQKNDQDVELVRLNGLLTGYRADYNTLQQNSLQLQLAADQQSGQISLVDQGGAVDTTQRPPYAATASILINQSPINITTTPSQTNLDQQAGNYAKLLSEGPVFQATIEKLGLPDTPASLGNKVLVDIVPGTRILRLTVTDNDAGRARLIADTIAENFLAQMRAILTQPYVTRIESFQKQMQEATDRINQTQDQIKTVTTTNVQVTSDIARLQNDLGQYRDDFRQYQQDSDQLRITAARSSDTLIISEGAHDAQSPSQSRSLYILLAMIVGAMIGVIVGFLVESTNDQVLSSADVQQKLGLSTIGTIGKLEKGNGELVTAVQPLSGVSEDFRVLGHNIRLQNEENHIKTLLVTSPLQAEGKSVVVSNLAVVLAKSGIKVLVVDADLRLPRQHTIFNLPDRIGFSEALLTGTVNGNTQHSHIDRLNVITSGNEPENPSDLFRPRRLMEVLAELSRDTDIVLIDCPPVMSVADTTILSSMVDGVLLVLRAGRVDAEATRDAINALKQVKAPLLGVVLNDVHDASKSHYRYYKQAPKKTGVRGLLSKISQEQPPLTEISTKLRKE